MKVLVNYANIPWQHLQVASTASATELSKFDKVMSYGPFSAFGSDLRFYWKNSHILTAFRGDGYWIWKPYIILKSLRKIAYGDYLFYLDSGVKLIKSIDPLIERMNSYGQDILPFAPGHKQARCRVPFTKRDALVLMGMDDFCFPDTCMTAGNVLLLKRSSYSMDFVAEWLHYVQDERIVTDMPNQCGKPNHPEFIENRHDQTVLDLLRSKHGLALSEWSEARFPSDIRPSKYEHFTARFRRLPGCPAPSQDGLAFQLIRIRSYLEFVRYCLLMMCSLIRCSYRPACRYALQRDLPRLHDLIKRVLRRMRIRQ